MRAIALRLLILVALLCLAAPAHATRVALYRVGASFVWPGSVKNPGTYETGYGFNGGVSVPFRHRVALTLDVSYDQLGWEAGSENVSGTRDDLGVTSFLLGADIAFRRGHPVRPLITGGLGVARVDPGEANFVAPFSNNSAASESKTVFAAALAVGARIRPDGWPIVMRFQIGLMGLARDEFEYSVPLRAQLEF